MGSPWNVTYIAGDTDTVIHDGPCVFGGIVATSSDAAAAGVKAYDDDTTTTPSPAILGLSIPAANSTVAALFGDRGVRCAVGLTVETVAKSAYTAVLWRT